MIIQVKNMVCDRCKMAVKAEFEKFGLIPVSVSLGTVELSEELPTAQLIPIEQALTRIGFELIDDKKSKITERIKNIIVELVHYRAEPVLVKLSEHIASQIGHEYPYLSKVFSEVEGTTIEQYIIMQKIERVKELLSYGQLTLNEISDQLGYSSVQHLSQQFRKVTGITASAYKSSEERERNALDKL